jgi:hypothetical protein
MMEVVARITLSLTVYIRPTLHALFLRCPKRPAKGIGEWVETQGDPAHDEYFLAERGEGFPRLRGIYGTHMAEVI